MSGNTVCVTYQHEKINFFFDELELYKETGNHFKFHFLTGDAAALIELCRHLAVKYGTFALRCRSL